MPRREHEREEALSRVGRITMVPAMSASHPEAAPQARARPDSGRADQDRRAVKFHNAREQQEDPERDRDHGQRLVGVHDHEDPDG